MLAVSMGKEEILLDLYGGFSLDYFIHIRAVSLITSNHVPAHNLMLN